MKNKNSGLLIISLMFLNLFGVTTFATEMMYLPTYSPTGIEGASWKVERDNRYDVYYLTFTNIDAVAYNRIPFLSAGKIILTNTESLGGALTIKVGPPHNRFILSSNKVKSTNIITFDGISKYSAVGSVVRFFDLGKPITPEKTIEVSLTSQKEYGENGIMASGELVMAGVPHAFKMNFLKLNNDVIMEQSLAIDQNGDGLFTGEKINIITQDGTVLDLDELSAKIQSVEKSIQTIEKELKEQRTILRKIIDFFKRIFGG